nr:MAG TPA: hypothetical protein [Caudoviricetes sp.]
MCCQHQEVHRFPFYCLLFAEKLLLLSYNTYMDVRLWRWAS